MSHIFGISHTLGGIISQVGSIFGDAAADIYNNPFGIGGIVNAVTEAAGGGGQGDFLTPPDEGQPGFAGNGGTVATNGNACTPGTTEIREVVIDKATGAVICIREKKTRRRRRRLATQSDISDLAALKNILGGGKAFDSWIATRGRR